MKRLIITADDFGITDDVCSGIVRSMNCGVVTSTSAMVCAHGAAVSLEKWASKAGCRIGVHLQLTDGVPLSDPSHVPSLVTAQGAFPRSWRDLGMVEADEIRAEWECQIETVLALGIEPTHLDTHHSIHRFPVIFRVYCELARQYDLPVRTMLAPMSGRLRSLGIPSADHCEEGWYGGELSIATLVKRVQRAFARCGGKGIVELMTHPGYADESLTRRSKYIAERERELAVLCDPRLPEQLKDAGVELCGVACLAAGVTNGGTHR